MNLIDQSIVRRTVVQVRWPFYKTDTPRKRTGKTEVNLCSKWGCARFEAPIALSMGRDPFVFIGKGFLCPMLRLDTMVAKR